MPTNLDLHYDMADQIDETGVLDAIQLLLIHHRKFFKFRDAMYELAFGNDAIYKNYTDEEVIDKLFKDLQTLQKYEDTKESN